MNKLLNVDLSNETRKAGKKSRLDLFDAGVSARCLNNDISVRSDISPLSLSNSSYCSSAVKTLFCLIFFSHSIFRS